MTVVRAPRRPPKPPTRSARPGGAVARLDDRGACASKGPEPPHARRAPAEPWHASMTVVRLEGPRVPTRSARPGGAVARLDDRGTPRRAPSPSMVGARVEDRGVV